LNHFLPRWPPFWITLYPWWPPKIQTPRVSDGRHVWNTLLSWWPPYLNFLYTCWPPYEKYRFFWGLSYCSFLARPDHPFVSV
jgi:hypothetical protein